MGGGRLIGGVLLIGGGRLMGGVRLIGGVRLMGGVRLIGGGRLIGGIKKAETDTTKKGFKFGVLYFGWPNQPS